jgi:hypothetical protein
MAVEFPLSTFPLRLRDGDISFWLWGAASLSLRLPESQPHLCRSLMQHPHGSSQCFLVCTDGSGITQETIVTALKGLEALGLRLLKVTKL